jgi:hypothetical protein
MLSKANDEKRYTNAFIPEIGSPKDMRTPQQPSSSNIIFDSARISKQDYKDYISFVDNIFSHQNKGLIQSRYNIEQALEILHNSGYSVDKAKFWVQFPVLYKLEFDPEEVQSSPPSI